MIAKTPKIILFTELAFDSVQLINIYNLYNNLLIGYYTGYYYKNSNHGYSNSEKIFITFYFLSLFVLPLFAFYKWRGCKMGDKKGQRGTKGDKKEQKLKSNTMKGVNQRC